MTSSDLLHEVGETIMFVTSLLHLIWIDAKILEHVLLFLPGVDRLADLALVERDRLVEVVESVLLRLPWLATPVASSRATHQPLSS